MNSSIPKHLTLADEALSMLGVQEGVNNGTMAVEYQAAAIEAGTKSISTSPTLSTVKILLSYYDKNNISYIFKNEAAGLFNKQLKSIRAAKAPNLKTNPKTASIKRTFRHKSPSVNER